MADDVAVLEDEIQAYDDGTVARIRILDIPESDQYPEEIKYAFHYGEAGANDQSSAMTTITAHTNSISQDKHSRSNSTDFSHTIRPGVLHSRPRNVSNGSRLHSHTNP
ncbi:hypothetical protein [Haloarcula marina]|uniref:hypothetical protein n=1 Tax=Haloarcula marina TaxID=2961574 RepID=UPI0020B72731|nr:hypothetical protein [Halomicroarcula marina]